MAIPAGHDNWVVGCCSIERCTQRRVFGIGIVSCRILPLRNGKPLSWPKLRPLNASVDDRGNFSECMRLRMQITATEIDNPDGMHVDVYQTREHQLTAGILHRCLRPNKRRCRRVRPDEDDLSVFDGKSFYCSMPAIDRIDLAILEHHVRQGMACCCMAGNRCQAQRCGDGEPDTTYGG